MKLMSSCEQYHNNNYQFIRGIYCYSRVQQYHATLSLLIVVFVYSIEQEKEVINVSDISWRCD